MNIIKFVSNRWEEYRDLRLKALGEQTAFDITPEEETQRINEDWQREADELANSDKRLAFIVETDGKLVGMVGANIGETEKSKHLAVVFGMYVLPEFRGQGLSKRLMQTLEENLKERGVIKINIGVYTSQTTAVELYKSLGFRIVGTLEKELKYNNEYFDLYEMEKIIALVG